MGACMTGICGGGSGRSAAEGSGQVNKCAGRRPFLAFALHTKGQQKAAGERPRAPNPPYMLLQLVQALGIGLAVVGEGVVGLLGPPVGFQVVLGLKGGAKVGVQGWVVCQADGNWAVWWVCKACSSARPRKQGVRGAVQRARWAGGRQAGRRAGPWGPAGGLGTHVTVLGIALISILQNLHLRGPAGPGRLAVDQRRAHDSPYEKNTGWLGRAGGRRRWALWESPQGKTLSSGSRCCLQARPGSLGASHS